MNKTVFKEEKVLIDTYPEAEREQLPMFAENRVHQRTSGNPYPNKVVLEAQRKIREKREYTLLRLENEFLEIGVLPELGGKIWYARDKKTGEDLFYQNHVVKPALIGVLGSWTSGGVEFNWPFHHRASTFMPVDYLAEENDDGITVWLSEHEPFDRMKGMVGIRLKNDESVFETCVKLDNTTPLRRSFLWWENAAVAVNTAYELFFPEDVNYVRFHYKRSVTTYPIANNDRFGAYNGILYNGDTDISKHANTTQATSYFSAESRFDYFGGYDHEKQVGVVHVADRHISPGKKMFTWAYGQLAKTWENALTDTNGQYAELMAGCYSDNQPDLCWIEPYETKTFSQFWYPIHGCGKPVTANENGALFYKDGRLIFMSVRPFRSRVRILRGGKAVSDCEVDFCAHQTTEIYSGDADGTTVLISDGGENVLEYEFGRTFSTEIPEPRKELPDFKSVTSAQELYLEGVHMEQYRSPEYNGEACWLRSLELEPDFAPSMVALAEKYIDEHRYKEALLMLERAEKTLTRFNARPESGKVFYLKGLALCAAERFDEAYDAFYKASWNGDCVACASLHAGLLALRRGDLKRATEHMQKAVNSNGLSVVAGAFYGYCLWKRGETVKAEELLNGELKKDGLNMYARLVLSFVRGSFDVLFSMIKTDLTQVVLDLAEYLLEAGQREEVVVLLGKAEEKEKLGDTCAYLHDLLTGSETAVASSVGIAFPSRSYEEKVLRLALKKNEKDAKAHLLLGELLYGKGCFEEGTEQFEECLKYADDYVAYRNLAVAEYSHRKNAVRAKESMALARRFAPKGEKQIEFESVYLMQKTGEAPKKVIEYLLQEGYDRDDLTVELARAYNHADMPEKALDVLLARAFVACEGGEHYIADQYMYAWYSIGRRLYIEKRYEDAMQAFIAGQTLPQSLGSGLWNEIKLVPFKYFQAVCLEKLGKTEDARRVFCEIIKFPFDYFSDQYCISYAYFKAKALELLGEKDEGVKIARARLSEFEKASLTVDTGYFGTTPFFISFIDDSATSRMRFYAYPLMLLSAFLGDDDRVAKYKKILSEETYGTYIVDFTQKYFI